MISATFPQVVGDLVTTFSKPGRKNIRQNRPFLVSDFLTVGRMLHSLFAKEEVQVRSPATPSDQMIYLGLDYHGQRETHGVHKAVLCMIT